ncbi:MAG: hypothetical protein WC337_10765, partial [Candidatus Muiribacteriota bacterium]
RLFETFTQIVVIPENRNELEPFIEHWKNVYEKYGALFEICEDTVVMKKNHIITLKRLISGKHEDTQFYVDTINDLRKKYKIRINENIELAQNYFKRKICYQLFNNPLQASDKQGICFHDSFYEYAYPDDHEQKKIVSDYYKTRQYLGFFDKPDICLNCINYTNVNLKKAHDNAPTEDVFNMYSHRLETGAPYEFYNIRFENEQDGIIAQNFLEQNDYYTLFSKNVKLKNSYYKGSYKEGKKSEKVFCIGWTGYLKVKNGQIYTGCSKKDIKIEDYNDFTARLKNGDLSLIPESCVLCKEKFSHNSLIDRFRVYGENTFHSPINPGIEKLELFNSIENSVKNNDFIFAVKLAESFNRSEAYLNIIENAVFYDFIDNNILYEKLKEIKDYFMLDYYCKLTQKHFSDCINFLINNFSYAVLNEEIINSIIKEIHNLTNLENLIQFVEKLKFILDKKEIMTSLEEKIISLMAVERVDKKSLKYIETLILNDIFSDDFFNIFLETLLMNFESRKEVFQAFKHYHNFKIFNHIKPDIFIKAWKSSLLNPDDLDILIEKIVVFKIENQHDFFCEYVLLDYIKSENDINKILSLFLKFEAIFKIKDINKLLTDKINQEYNKISDSNLQNLKNKSFVILDKENSEKLPGDKNSNVHKNQNNKKSFIMEKIKKILKK